MAEIAVNQLHGGVGDGADILFTFNDRLISVSILPSNGSSTKDTRHLRERPLQDHLVDTISQASTCEDYDEYDELEDEVLGVILDAGRPLFSRPISPQGASSQNNQNSQSLHHFLFPPVLYFRLEAPASCASIVPINSSEANTILTAEPTLDRSEDERKVYQDLPRYIPEEIVVTKSFVRGANTITAAVKVQGQDMFCKSRGGPLFHTGEGRELECLSEMLKAFPQPSTVRIPRLLGYIHHKENKQVIGFLRQWVPGRSLQDINIATTTAKKRHKWISQVRENIKYLHKHGLVWGDGKSSNIIIDEQDDAWLIDFGGGFTEGWVDEQLAETEEGDKQALSKIAELLSEGNSASLSL